MLLDEKEEFVGQFWLPEHLDKPPLDGTLTINVNGRATLDLRVPTGLIFSEEVKQGNKEAFLGVPFSQDEPHRVDEWVVGRLSNHRYVALKDCHDRSGVFMLLPTREAPRLDMRRTMKMLVGGPVLMTGHDCRQEPASARARIVTLQIDGLREWFSDAGIRTESHPHYESTPVAVSYELPEDQLSLNLSIDDRSCALSMRHVWINPHWSAAAIKLNQDVIATLTCADPQPIGWWQRTAIQLGNLLTFVTRSPCRVQQMNAVLEAGELPLPRDPNGMRVFYPDVFPHADNGKRTGMLFSARDMDCSRFQEIIQGWFDLCGDSTAHSAPLLAILASVTRESLDSQCAYIVAALGKLASPPHRDETAERAYAEIKSLVDECELADATRSWFESLSGRGLFYESKQQQFRRLMEKCGLKELIGDEHTKRLATAIAKLRQDVVYGNSNPELSLYWPALAILDISILRKIGFTEEETENIIRTNYGRLGHPLGLPASPT